MPFRRSTLASLFFTGLIAMNTCASAQTPTAAPPPPCSSAEYRQLDFWVGDWDGVWDNGDGTTGHARNRITRDEFGACVIYEHFTADAGGLSGMSISTWVPRLKQWRQTWVDDKGGWFNFVGGPMTGPDGVFYFENVRESEGTPIQRMVFQDVTPDAFTWRWQAKVHPTDPWIDRWVIKYTRRRS